MTDILTHLDQQFAWVLLFLGFNSFLNEFPFFLLLILFLLFCYFHYLTEKACLIKCSTCSGYDSCNSCKYSGTSLPDCNCINADQYQDPKTFECKSKIHMLSISNFTLNQIVQTNALPAKVALMTVLCVLPIEQILRLADAIHDISM